MIDHQPYHFILNGKRVQIEAESSNLTLLQYLRRNTKIGSKEGCAEGDCGACTVIIAEPEGSEKMKYTAVDSCLVFLPMIHGKQLITVENLEQHVDRKVVLHPVQQAMVENYGAQCGYCTPGIIMSLFALYKNHHLPSKEVVADALTGNLCRCTGYQAIADAAAAACNNHGEDQFTDNEKKIRALLAQINRSETITLEKGGQKYFVPFTLSEALRLRKENPDAVIVSGATDTALRQTKKHEVLHKIIDLSHVEELNHFQDTDKSLIVGAGTKIEKLRKLSAKRLPAIHSLLCVFGSLQVRSLATIGGNIGSASPIGDALPLLFAHKARVTVKSTQSERVIPIDEFITGYRRIDLKSDELIVAIEIPFPSENELIWSQKVSKRKDLDISTVSAAFNLKTNTNKTIESAVLAFGGMAEKTKRAYKTEEFLVGKEWNRTTVEKAMELLYDEFTPISDARSYADTRRLFAKNLLLKFWSEIKN